MRHRPIAKYLGYLIVPSLLVAAISPGPLAMAAFPSPSNDDSGSAIPVGPLPAILMGSNVNGDDTISATTLPGLGSAPGPDVFYSFTPPANGTYWIVMIPWNDTPVYSSTGGSVPEPDLAVYVRESISGVFVAGDNTGVRDQPDTIVASLTGGVAYDIVVDSVETLPLRQEFEFTLVVAPAPSASAEACFSGAAISNNLPTAVVNTLTGAVDDFTFVEGTGRCDVANTIGLGAAGPDHLYEFTTGPNLSDAGEYVFSLVPGGTVWNGYIYIMDSCPPFFPLGCLGAANHTAGSLRHAETIVVSLLEDKTYYVMVDAATTSLPDAKYTLFVDRAEGYDITELEPNDNSAAATPVSAAQNGGQIVGGGDVDFWSMPAQANDRVYAFLDNGNALLSSLDSQLTLLSTDGATPIEFDNDDGEGASSPVATLVFRSSSFSAAIAGARVPATGTYYLRASGADSLNTISRYLLHYGAMPGSRAPSPECEPNNTPLAADGSAKEYYAGTILEQNDVDHYTFEASAGDRVFIALDGDPERDSGGASTTDPNALDGALQVYDPDGDVLIERVNDTSPASPTPDYPAEVVFFTAPTSGTYTVGVSGGDSADFGAGRTYELAIFKNDAAGVVSEETDPVIDSLTPNFANNTIAVAASDDAPGDSGICNVSLSADSSNLTLLNVSFTPGDPTVAFDIGLIDLGQSGFGKIIITDCAGNTACSYVQIDANPPVCTGSNFTSGRRVFRSMHDPIYVPDNDPAGSISQLEVPGVMGVISDVNVTISVETIRPLDIDVFLQSPSGARIDVVSDRGGSSVFDITDATFDDSATAFMSLLSSDAPYTGTWLPDDPAGLAAFNGQVPQGTWTLNVIDDSTSASGGGRIIRWSLDIAANFPGPEEFHGTATDTLGVNGGIASITLSGTNLQLNLPPDFMPGDTVVDYTVTLINPAMNGSGSVRVVDLSNNSCLSNISLNGLTDLISPMNSGSVTRNLEFGAEVQTNLVGDDHDGVVSSALVADSVTAGKVVVDLTVDTLDIGRIASTLTHAGEFSSLLNRVGMAERDSVGRTKDNIDITLDDDAPVADDAHLESALGTVPFIGLHQPDGRGEFIGNGIDADLRANMLLNLNTEDTSGLWDLYVADFREQGASTVVARFRRWTATVSAPSAAERFVGTVTDVYPGGGICTIELAPGAVNLNLAATFTPGQEVVDYIVTLVAPTTPGSGTVEITDCGGNTTMVPIALNAELADQKLPVCSGSVDVLAHKFDGTATDEQLGDSGIAAVELAPYSNNLQIVSVTPDPPNGASSVSFVVGLVNPAANGNGYIRVTDAAGHRCHSLIQIDATSPVCTGLVGHTKRYVSGGDVPVEIPDNNTGGVSSNIVVPDPDIVTDTDITINIIHGFDDDIDLTLTNPIAIVLFTDIGSTGNDFIDTTLDDEAAAVIPDSAGSAPFTGSFKPEPPAVLSVLDNRPALGTYTLRVVDDAVFNRGSFQSWSLTMTSPTFPERYDGRAQDGEALGLGLCSIELLPGALNTSLTVDAFVPGDKIVRYSVQLINPLLEGGGTVRVTDCAGNSCDVPVCLQPNVPPMDGDFDGDGDVDVNDFAGFDACYTGAGLRGGFACGDVCNLADFDDDGDVDLVDFDGFQNAFDVE